MASANKVPLPIKLDRDAAKYFESLDQTTKKRIKDKLEELASDPFNIRTSKPLKQSTRRSARVGSYRILFAVEANICWLRPLGHEARFTAPSRSLFPNEPITDPAGVE